MNKWQKLGLAASTAVLSLGIVSENPAQASSFAFDFAGEGQGSLSFTNTPLTGLTGFGEESISLDDLYNLAEDVSFQFSFPSTLYNFEPRDIDYGTIDFNEGNFHFFNGKLLGIDFEIVVSLDEYYDQYVQFFGEKTFLVKKDRYTEFLDFERTMTTDDYQFLEPNYEIYTTYHFEDKQTHQIEEEGISYQITSLKTELLLYYIDGEFGSEYKEYPENSSGFTRYDELPQITFTTLDPITPSEPIPEPLTLLGTGTAIAFGLSFKKLKQRKKK